MSESLSVSRLRELLRYELKTGQFHWISKRNGTNGVGSIAGTSNQNRHIIIGIDGIRYMAHRLVWLYMYEVWPSNEIDHINRDKADNRIINLREVTRSQNVQNTLLRSSNTSGHKGVSWKKEKNCWAASIAVNGKQRHLGYFKTIEEAAASYKAAAAFVHTHNPLAESA